MGKFSKMAVAVAAGALLAASGVVGQMGSGGNYTVHNRVSDRYEVDSVWYRDIFGSGMRNLTSPSATYRQMLEGNNIFDNEYYGTHREAWMNIARLCVPLHSWFNVVNNAFMKEGWEMIVSNSKATSVERSDLFIASSISGAAGAMLQEFRLDRNSGGGADRYDVDKLISVPNDLSALSGPQTVLWALDKIKHGAGGLVIGTGVIFYDFKLSYLETGEEFYSAVSGLDRVSAPVPGFTYNYGDAQESVVNSSIRNTSGLTATYTQTWTDRSDVTVGNEVSTLNGYEMSHMYGVGSAVATTLASSTNTTTTTTVKADAKFSIPLVFNASASAEVKHVVGRSHGYTHENQASTTEEFVTSDLFQHRESASSSKTVTRSMDYSVEVQVPPHTQVRLKQGPANISMNIDYDYPVVISYKVKTVGIIFSRNRDGFMQTLATFGHEGGEATIAEMDAAENLHKRWENRDIPGYKTMHSVDTISFERTWRRLMEPYLGDFDRNEFGYYGLTVAHLLWPLEEAREMTDEMMQPDLGDHYIRVRFIRPVTWWIRMRDKPMTVTGANLFYSSSSMVSEIHDFQPLYPLHRIEAPGLDEINLINNGGRYLVDNIALTGKNAQSVDFHGFHKDKGRWVLTNADQTPHNGSIASIISAPGTGRPTLVASDNSVGTVYLRYLINDDTYIYGDATKYMTAADVAQTAIIPVNVKPVGALGIASQPEGGTMTVTSSATYPLTVDVVATGDVSYQWYVNTEPSSTGGLPIAGATGPTYNAPLGSIGVFYYYVVVSMDDPDVEPVVSMHAPLSVIEEQVGVAGAERVIPGNPGDEALVAPAKALSVQFTAGPNPVGRSSGRVNFFRQGKQVEGASLVVYDVAGNVINRVQIRDTGDGNGTNGRRVVGSWDLRDRKGRVVSEGMYLVRGAVTTVDGRKERVSLMVGVR